MKNSKAVIGDAAMASPPSLSGSVRFDFGGQRKMITVVPRQRLSALNGAVSLEDGEREM